MKRLAILGLAPLAWFAGVAGLIVLEEPRSAARQADVAIVLGAALGAGGKPSPVFEGRLEHAAMLYRKGSVRRLLFTGGRGKGMQRSEAGAARDWAVLRGVPASAILIEERSRTTWQNLDEAREVMARARLRTALIVSDPLHLPRALRMARDLGIRAEPSPTASSRYRSVRTRIPFLGRESFFLTGYWLSGN